MTSDLLALPPIDGRSPQPFAPVRVCPIELAQAIAQGLELAAAYDEWRAEQGMPPSTLAIWHFVAAVSPPRLLPEVLRWLDATLTPSAPN